jgi:biotin synthase
MPVDPLLSQILNKAGENCSPTKEECIHLLSFQEQSLEAGTLIAAANEISRRRFDNCALLLGQVGMEGASCPGQCKFCAFGEGHAIPSSRLNLGQILERARAFCAGEDLYALFLMTMHDTDFPRLLDTISAVRRTIPAGTQIVLNTGDLDGSRAEELRCAGANGAYHICRLREGTDTGLHPSRRIRTLELIRAAGLDLYYCCEPVGPEHTAQELVEQIFIGIRFGCFQHGAMRRIPVPGTPLFGRGQITERRLAQIVAVTVLATLECKETKIIIVHEPGLLGLGAGANAIYAETGASPRDTAPDTSGHRGLDMFDCRAMLSKAGFAGLKCGDDTIPLGVSPTC